MIPAFIPYIIPLLDSFLQFHFLAIWFYPVFALAFLATVPCIFRYFFRRA